MTMIPEAGARPKDRKRLDWVDALKGFAIFCVTFGHCNPWQPLETYIYSFHMFVFFFISGFLFSVKSTQKKMILGCVKKILVPFILWNTISAVADYVSSNDWELFIKELFVLEGTLTSNPPIWFLLVLFIAEMIFIVLRLHRRIWISASAMVICAVLWILYGETWALWKLNLVPMALCFFIFGYVFKPFVGKIGKKYILLPLTIPSIYCALMNVRLLFTKGRFGNYFYCITAAVCGTIIMVGLFASYKPLSKFGFLKTWGRNSLFIMATQYFIFHRVTELSEKYLDMNLMKHKDTFISFLVALGTILLISLVLWVIKKLTYRSRFLRAIGGAFGVQYDILPVKPESVG